MLRRVVLPLPEGPRMDTKAPSSIKVNTPQGIYDGLPKTVNLCYTFKKNPSASFAFTRYSTALLTHQLQNSLCIYDADVLEKLCQQHIIGL